MRHRELLLQAVVIVIVGIIFWNESGQGFNWSFPYFSGAANLETLPEWRISPSDYEAASGLDAPASASYRHRKTEDTVPYDYNAYGYVLVVWVARRVFFWMGDANAVRTLQLTCHLAMCLGVLALLASRAQRWTFWAIYGINPVVLHFVTFPYYYFWAAIPSVCLAVVWWRPRPLGAWLLPVGLSLFAAYLIRPTTILVCLLVLGVACSKERRLAALAMLAVFLGLIVGAAPDRTGGALWHTAFIGIGAYANDVGVSGPRDDVAYAYYREVTGEGVDSDPFDGVFNDRQRLGDYQRVLRARYLRVARERPGLLLRNAVFNTVEAFGFGYDVDRRWLTFVSGVVGGAMIVLIAISRQWIWGLGILASVATFTFYFPPIPAYLFGAYMLTSLAVAGVVAEAVPAAAARRSIVVLAESR